MGKSMSNKDKLRQLEERNERLCDDVAVYQNICVDELCEKYADILATEYDFDEDDALPLLKALASEIHKIYFD